MRRTTFLSVMLSPSKASLVANTNRGIITQRKSSIRLFAYAITDALAGGARTKDIAGPGVNAVGTPEMGDAIVRELERRA